VNRASKPIEVDGAKMQNVIETRKEQIRIGIVHHHPKFAIITSVLVHGLSLFISKPENSHKSFN
jgi:hypothetical protein